MDANNARILFADYEARKLYGRGLLTLCEAQDADPSIEPERSVRDCECEFGAATGRHLSADARQTIRNARTAMEQMQNLAFAEGSISMEDRALIGSVDLNLYNTLNQPVEQAPAALMRAAYCLGRVADRMDTLAGDVPGRRCKKPEFRNEYRSYREVARETAQALATLMALKV